VHANEVSGSGLGAALVGAAVGVAAIPTLGGLLLGGAVGAIVRHLNKNGGVAKKRIFVSFDFDHDRALKDFILGQAKLKDSPFEVIDHSLQEAAPEHNWETKARAAIKRSDLVLVMVGQYTHRAHGVLKEVKMARDADVPIVQVIGYRDEKCTPVANAGRLYAWNWVNLKRLLG
jgi:glycerophosphoryl diester phosphodiesterase